MNNTIDDSDNVNSSDKHTQFTTSETFKDIPLKSLMLKFGDPHESKNKLNFEMKIPSDKILAISKIELVLPNYLTLDQWMECINNISIEIGWNKIIYNSSIIYLSTVIHPEFIKYDDSYIYITIIDWDFLAIHYSIYRNIIITIELNEKINKLTNDKTPKIKIIGNMVEDKDLLASDVRKILDEKSCILHSNFTFLIIVQNVINKLDNVRVLNISKHTNGLIFYDSENYLDYIVGDSVVISFENDSDIIVPITRHKSGVPKDKIMAELDSYLIKDLANIIEDYIPRKCYYSIAFDQSKINKLLYPHKTYLLINNANNITSSPNLSLKYNTNNDAIKPIYYNVANSINYITKGFLLSFLESD
jgi:hypothetical protein